MATFPIVPGPSYHKTRATLTISTAADGLSDILDVGGLTPSSICMSTAWTAASMTFRGSHQSTDHMYDIYTSTGGEVTHTVDANRLVVFDVRPLFEGVRYIQVRSGTAAVPVAQAEARSICIGMHNGA